MLHRKSFWYVVMACLAWGMVYEYTRERTVDMRQVTSDIGNSNPSPAARDRITQYLKDSGYEIHATSLPTTTP